MSQHIPPQLQELSDRIRDEEMSIIIEQMVPFVLNEVKAEDEPKDLRKQTEQEKGASLLLRSMRIHMCLDLIRQGHSACIEQFREDWKEILECLKFLEMEWDVTNEILGDAVDVITLLCPERRKEILRLLDFSTRLKIKQRSPLRPELVQCAFLMGLYCEKTKRSAELLRIGESLIALSAERNTAAPDSHRTLTAQWLAYMVDYDHALALRICQTQRRSFQGVVSAAACKFHWLWAFTQLSQDPGEEAVSLLKHCQDLCMQVEGGTSWLGARAGSLYWQMMLNTDHGEEAEEFLWDLLEKIDSGFYRNMDDTAPFVAATTRASLLSLCQANQKMHGLLPQIRKFYDYCAANEDTNINPELTVRHAENYLAAYYLENGDYLQATHHTQVALNTVPPNGLEKKPTDAILYSNLLTVAINLNDADQIGQYSRKLLELEPEYEDDDFLRTRVTMLFLAASKKVAFEGDEEEDDAQDAPDDPHQLLAQYHSAIRNQEGEVYDSNSANTHFSQQILEMCSSILNTFSADREELLRIRDIISYFLDRPGIYRFSDSQKCTAYIFLTQTEWQLGSDKALEHLSRGLEYIDSIESSREVRISVLRLAAMVYYNYHLPQQSRAMLDAAFSGITSAWQKATAYLNDHRICQMLSYIQQDFGFSLSLLRASAPDDELYERILQFKDLPALVGRERNRLLRMAPVDDRLKQQIFMTQDHLAAAKLNDALNGTDTAMAIAAELMNLEGRFAEQFPRDRYFTEITFPGVCKKLPEGAAIVEYFFTLNESALTGGPFPDSALELDVFITAKRNGSAKLDHLKIPRGDTILDMAADYIQALQAPDDLCAAGTMGQLRCELYRTIIAPVLPFLEGITDLYLAPDDLLCNLPLEILCAADSGTLQEAFRVCRLVCGRDLLFYDDRAPSGGGCFILGDPDYEAIRGEISDSRTRSASFSLEPLPALPFSGIEAARIGGHCRTRICSGSKATKYALQNALPCSIIHLATHGVFDEEMQTDSLYSSHLVFAGYNRWVSDKQESSFCGNGLLTADEISRMDLNRTELVVLSACQSGLGDTTYRSTRGLLSAFSAAGARWIVSHLWRADDFATAILMDAFYDAMRRRGMEVPDALQHAKQYLQNVTVGSLRRNGWFDLPRDGRIPAPVRKELLEMRDLPAHTRPFEDEYYWGGFTVHKSR